MDLDQSAVGWTTETQCNYQPGVLLPSLANNVGKSFIFRISNFDTTLLNPYVVDRCLWGGNVDTEKEDVKREEGARKYVYTSDSDIVAIVHHSGQFRLATYPPPFQCIDVTIDIQPERQSYPGCSSADESYCSKSFLACSDTKEKIVSISPRQIVIHTQRQLSSMITKTRSSISVGLVPVLHSNIKNKNVINIQHVMTNLPDALKYGTKDIHAAEAGLCTADSGEYMFLYENARFQRDQLHWSMDILLNKYYVTIYTEDIDNNTDFMHIYVIKKKKETKYQPSNLMYTDEEGVCADKQLLHSLYSSCMLEDPRRRSDRDRDNGKHEKFINQYSFTKQVLKNKHGSEASAHILQAMPYLYTHQDSKHLQQNAQGGGPSKKKAKGNSSNSTDSSLTTLPKKETEILTQYLSTISDKFATVDKETLVSPFVVGARMPSDDKEIYKDQKWSEFVWSETSLFVRGKEYTNIKFLRFTPL